VVAGGKAHQQVKMVARAAELGLAQAINLVQELRVKAIMVVPDKLITQRTVPQAAAAARGLRGVVLLQVQRGLVLVARVLRLQLLVPL
jgi:hypothetical protein